MCRAFPVTGPWALGRLPMTPPPRNLRNGTEIWRSAPDVAPDVVLARAGRSFGARTPAEIQMTPDLSCTVERAVMQHATECLAGLARPVSVAPATAAADAQIVIAHMVSSAFLFNDLMLSLSGQPTASSRRSSLMCAGLVVLPGGACAAGLQVGRTVADGAGPGDGDGLARRQLSASSRSRRRSADDDVGSSFVSPGAGGDGI